jgi:hypothetical protein
MESFLHRPVQKLQMEWDHLLLCSNSFNPTYAAGDSTVEFIEEPKKSKLRRTCPDILWLPVIKLSKRATTASHQKSHYASCHS